MKRVFTLLLLLFSIGSFGQLSLLPGGQVLLRTCEASVQTIQISQPGNFSASDQIHVGLDMDDSLSIFNFQISTAGTVTASGDQLLITGVNGVNQFTLSYSVRPECSFIIQQSNAITYDQLITVNVNSSSASVHQVYTIIPAILVFRGGNNLNVINAHINQTITRTYVYKNTSSQAPFTGVFRFGDTLVSNYATGGLRIDTVYVSSSNATEISHAITDTSAILTLQVNNLVQNNDSLVITEVVTLVDCRQGTFDNSQTRMTAYYGCSVNDLCKQVAIPNNIGNIILATIDQSFRPRLDYIPKYTMNGCFYNQQERSYKFINNGTDTASNVIMHFHQIVVSSIHNMSTIDTQSIVVKHFNGSTYDQLPFTLTPVPIVQSVWRFLKLDLNRKLAPGDSVMLSFNINNECIQPYDYDSIALKSEINFHNIAVSAKLDHACFPDSIGMDYAYTSTSHPYSFSQFFNNMNAVMGDGATAWFEVESSNKLNLAELTTNPKVIPVKLDSTEIEVRVVLDGGLGLTSNSDFFIEIPAGASTISFTPYYVTVHAGPFGIGSGDTIIARFRFSDLNANYDLSDPFPYLPYIHQEKLNGDYYALFSKFKVKFKLEAFCEFAPSNGRVNIKEQFLLVLNPSCRSCLLPLESVSSYTNVNCPGCVLPGWNLTSFDLQRKNYGYADNNNNYLPDSYPQTGADTLLIDRKRAMIGDTLTSVLTGWISEGQDFAPDSTRVGYTFSSIGFNFDEGQLIFFSNQFDNLQFLGATGTFTHNGIGYPITIPASAGAYSPTHESYYINMSAAALQSFGVTGFTGYAANDHIAIRPEFRVVRNLTDNDGPQSYFGTQTINCFYVMGGEPFNVPFSETGYSDANDINMNHGLDTMTTSQREHLFYWCTAWETRYVGVGYDMARAYSGAENLAFYWNYMQYYENNPSVCHEVIHFDHSMIAGYRNAGDYLPQYEGAFSFPFEIREVSLLDTLRFNFPAEYEVDKILFANFNPFFDTVKNETQWDGYAMMFNNYPHGFYYYEYDLSNATLGSNYAEVYPAANMDQITSYPYNNYGNSSYLWQKGETKIYSVHCFLKPKNCSTIPLHVSNAGNTVVAKYSKLPLDLGDGDSTMVFVTGSPTPFISNDQQFTSPKPKFSFQQQHNYQFNAAGTVSWDVSFSSKKYGNTNDDYYATSIENAFLSFFSASGRFSNFSIPVMNSYLNTNINNGSNIYFHPGYNHAVQQLDTIYADQLYPQQTIFGVGYMGIHTEPSNMYSKELTMRAEFNCSDLLPGQKDSVGIIMGWNCFGYPASAATACYTDTVYFVVEVPDLSANVIETLPSSISACDTAHLSFLVDVAGVGEMRDFNVTVENGGSGSFQYVPGSASLASQNSSNTYPPTVTPQSWSWSLNSLASNLSENDFIFSLDVATGCEVANDTLDIHIHGENFCGKVIADYHYSWKPAVTNGLPQLANLDVQMNSSTSAGQTSVTFTATNNGNAATGSLNTIVIPLPPGFSYTGNDPAITVSGNQLQIQLAAGIQPAGSQSISFVINHPSLSCQQHSLPAYVHTGEFFSCGNSTCVYEVTSDTLNIVVPPPAGPSCSFSGIAPDCNNPVQRYTAAGGLYSYNWSISNASNAVISGSSNGNFVDVSTSGCSGNFTLNLHITDNNSGCSSDCSQSFAFNDATAPQISSPGANYTLAGCEDSPVFTAPAATDNCGTAVVSVVSNTTVYNNDGTTTYSRTWIATDACGNISQQVTQVVTAPSCCQPQLLTGGSCQGCNSYVTVQFLPNNPSCVYVTSCKALSNIVLEDCNGTRYKFDNLSGNTGTFCHPSGLPLSTVWVKSGCFQSGDGPGYGRRFNNPCSCSVLVRSTDSSNSVMQNAGVFGISPNPFTNAFTVSYTTESTDKVEIVITDLLGAVVYTGQLPSGSISHQITLQHLSAGVYLATMRVNGNNVEVKRIVKTEE